ncbi:MAG: hypothetical protein KJ799_07755 [Bacteroidetes bacterium]|nr:hypothetical protein [Bacteroidota bacterium]MBU1677472.1 hypothetical protein [Bacteroidota bacterium]MBU2506602.1 hypothetical protein [Bacteroidota bacterium]
MTKYSYSLFSKFVYRYANFPLTILMSLFVLITLLSVQGDWRLLLPLIINVTLIYVLNRYYLKLYRSFPFTIEIDNEKIICSNFFQSEKRIELKLIDISDIKGGMFDGSFAKPVYLFSQNNIEIGLQPHIKNFNKLLTTILSNISQNLYEGILEKTKANNLPRFSKKIISDGNKKGSPKR